MKKPLSSPIRVLKTSVSSGSGGGQVCSIPLDTCFSKHTQSKGWLHNAKILRYSISQRSSSGAKEKKKRMEKGNNQQLKKSCKSSIASSKSRRQSTQEDKEPPLCNCLLKIKPLEFYKQKKPTNGFVGGPSSPSQ